MVRAACGGTLWNALAAQRRALGSHGFHAMVEIENAALLTDLFGHWPDFHDAELIALRLDAAGYEGPWLEADFEVAEMSSEIDERGYYRDRQRARATLRFGPVRRLRLEDFLYQNVLSSLELAPAGPDDFDEVFGPDEPDGRRRCRVRWGSAIGCTADFLCDSIAVTTAAPVARAT